MNERIKELAEQAKEYADTKYSKLVSTSRWGDSVPGIRELYTEKLAELIVRECMTMCDTLSADYLKHREAADDFLDKNIYAEGEVACDILRYKMKKHFGVEE
jgi:hypothetical protein